MNSSMFKNITLIKHHNSVFNKSNITISIRVWCKRILLFSGLIDAKRVYKNKKLMSRILDNYIINLYEILEVGHVNQFIFPNES